MNVSIGNDGRTVIFRLGLLETPLALKHRLEVPTERITRAEAVPRADIPHGSLVRAPGTYVPGLARLGSYGKKPNRQFWAVFRQDPVLVVDIEGWDYSRIVAGLPDAANTAGDILMAMS